VVGRRGGGYDDDDHDTTTKTTTTPFSSLLGEWHWRYVFRKMYEGRQGHWLTPVELFQPHYSHVLGNFCARQQQQQSSSSSSSSLGFEIVELGCGRGTNADLLLTYLKETKPDTYGSLRSYTLVDVSPSLHNLQRKTLSDGPHADKVRFELIDLTDVAEGT
jgi:SAM-dependent MidA family methyltransferase